MILTGDHHVEPPVPPGPHGSIVLRWLLSRRRPGLRRDRLRLPGQPPHRNSPILQDLKQSMQLMQFLLNVFTRETSLSPERS
jgi:hypothetical protein